MERKSTVEVDALRRLDIRVGTIRDARAFPEARKPLYRLEVDFGPDLGVLQSAAGLARHYDLHELPGRQVLAVVNFPPRTIAGFESECLVLGVPDDDGEPALVTPDAPVPDGGRLY